jgi:sec-independent protein translocase protein TatB
VRGLANDFQRGIDELARETELDEIRKDLEKSATLDLERQLEETIDPKGEMSEAVKELQAELKETGEEIEEQPKISSDVSHLELPKTQPSS